MNVPGRNSIVIMKMVPTDALSCIAKRVICVLVLMLIRALMLKTCHKWKQSVVEIY